METLRMRKNIEIEGECVVEGVTVEIYRAVINSNNPATVDFTSLVGDREKYKANADVADADRAAFREQAYAVQEELLAELTAKAEGVAE